MDAERDKKKSKGRRGMQWPVLVVGLLGAHVAGMVSAVTLINHRTRTLGVVDDYYDRAVHWDEHLKRVRESEKLGWRVRIETAEVVDRAGGRAVTFVLTDAGGKPVEGATMEVTCVHPAHADVPAHYAFGASGDGRFSHVLPMRYEGFYDFSITAKAGGKTFEMTTTQWVNTSQG